MTAWSGLVFQQNLLKVLHNLRKLIRQYNARTGPDAVPNYSFLTGRAAAVGGLSPLPGMGRLALGTLHLPTLRCAGSLPQASHLWPIPFVPFAALPICCAVAATATCAECEPGTASSPRSLSDSDTSAMEGAIWTIPIMQALADLRLAYELLVEDPLWALAMNGVGAEHQDAVVGQYMDLDEAIYEFATMNDDRSDMYGGDDQTVQEIVALEDPFAVLLEFAGLGLEGDV
ncbi:unnamed protein product [Ostreobium quekettii]|uniref:Uncharacterized protein n=1 Tax=Ostreobium quekettii TaxID=121088 RepID=A0A8S1IWH1_9CHLO|nr:unnamed protein product [Ostreobium quekettii]